MAENIKLEDIIEKKDGSTSETPEQIEAREKAEADAKAKEAADAQADQDPLKIELNRVQNSNQQSKGRSELQKAEYSLKKNAERYAQLGGDPTEALGIMVPNESEEDEDDKPVTKGELKKIIAEGGTKTALQLADDIQDETEKTLVKFYLENRIIPSGNPQEDLRDARRLVNSVKNEQIIAEANRKTPPKTHSSATGAPAKENELDKMELTPQELLFTRPPFKMTKEAIIAARKK